MSFKPPKTKAAVWRDVEYLKILLSKVDNTLGIYAHAENFVVKETKLGLNIEPIGISGKDQTVNDFLESLTNSPKNTKVTLNKENFSVSLGIDGVVFVDFVEPAL